MTRITAIDGADGFTPDMLRRRRCIHEWEWIDPYGWWFCKGCTRVESPDDDPEGPVAA